MNHVIAGALARLKKLRYGDAEPDRDDHVFVYRGKPYKQGIRTAFENAVRRAKLKGVTIHTLRHTFATRLDSAGASSVEIKELGR